MKFWFLIKWEKPGGPPKELRGLPEGRGPMVENHLSSEQQSLLMILKTYQWFHFFLSAQRSVPPPYKNSPSFIVWEIKHIWLKLRKAYKLNTPFEKNTYKYWQLAMSNKLFEVNNIKIKPGNLLKRKWCSLDFSF